MQDGVHLSHVLNVAGNCLLSQAPNKKENSDLHIKIAKGTSLL